MVTSKEAHEAATGLLIWRRLLLLLLRLSTTVKKATHELSRNATNASRAAAGLWSLATMLPTQERACESHERRLVLRLMFSTSDCVQR